MTNRKHVFTSESVSEGHPDKLCDQVSDAVLDACLAQDPHSRVACETFATTNFVIIGGELTTTAKVDYEKIARDVVTEIGYTKDEYMFNASTFDFDCKIHTQSPDISQGVTEGEGLHKSQGAGDQGMMFGYACTETESLMPAPITYSHKILEYAAELRKKGEISWLRPDSKSQLTIEYDNDKPVRIQTVVVSHQHDGEFDGDKRVEIIEKIIKPVLEPTGLLTGDVIYHVNPTGKFEIGGPHGDTGLTGRKIIVDTYGGMGRHGGGAFSGKDPSKVDRSAAYMARYIAKNVVAAGFCTRCEVELSYAIGVAEPTSVLVQTFGTGTVPEEKIEKAVSEVFDLTPSGIISTLNLKKPVFLKTASYGHFGRDGFAWEKTDKVEALKNAI